MGRTPLNGYLKSALADEAVNLKGIAYLAAIDPEGSSDIIPGFTNQQTAWLALSATHATYPPLAPPVPLYHYCAGTFDDYGFPTGLQFTNSDYMLEFAFAVPSFQSLGEIIDVRPDYEAPCVHGQLSHYGRET